MNVPSDRELARQQIIFARDYTNQLLEGVADEDWFIIPPQAPSHLAWQVGHLAMAMYGLTLMRIRDRQPEDEQLISKDFIRCFKKGSIPVPDASHYPDVAEIRRVSAAVFARAVHDMENYTESQLLESLPAPTAIYANKLGSLFMCAMHEMLHAGQIGLIRRQLGYEPVR